ncbi:aldehyde dehydrogenase family protein, partial [Burkholderia ubonensis]|uniref:aldehyde dehydrogenase family protein n=1 Tax=Burkholderia ubonensis TaxID=101571 RepID=UPI000B21BD79
MNAAVPQATVALPTAKLLIDGQFVESRTREWGDIVNPATQETIGRVPYATVDEVDAAIASAQRAFQTWKATPIGARMRIMLKFQDLVRANQQRIAKTLT